MLPATRSRVQKTIFLETTQPIIQGTNLQSCMSLRRESLRNEGWRIMQERALVKYLREEYIRMRDVLDSLSVRYSQHSIKLKQYAVEVRGVFKTVRQILLRDRTSWKCWQSSVFIVIYLPWCTITKKSTQHTRTTKVKKLKAPKIWNS